MLPKQTSTLKLGPRKIKKYPTPDKPTIFAKRIIRKINVRVDTAVLVTHYSPLFADHLDNGRMEFFPYHHQKPTDSWRPVGGRKADYCGFIEQNLKKNSLIGELTIHKKFSSSSTEIFWFKSLRVHLKEINYRC
uniref:Uncharacterized protein n=1 Tax=Romanomermis culicivorax TaxID=13658 RepID=A0A915KH17_ROMCU